MAKAPTEPFYVYRILGEMGETVYIGKGSGRRLYNQKRRFMSDGEVMERYSTDKRAFRRERELIAEFNPPLNKSPGGNGATRGLSVSGLPPLYAGLAKLIRRLSGLESPVRNYLTGMINDIAKSQGLAKFAAGLRPYGIEIVDG
jgi:hypothetical protein